MLLCLMISVISINAYVYASETSETVLLGDVNSDNKISIRDATLIQAYLVKMIDFSDKQFKCADVNEDDNVNVLDVTLIQKYKVGKKTNTRINQYIELNEPTEATTDNQWLPGFFD